jgi:hypothetical protein
MRRGKTRSVDHLVGAHKQRRRNLKANAPGLTNISLGKLYCEPNQR